MGCEFKKSCVINLLPLCQAYIPLAIDTYIKICAESRVATSMKENLWPEKGSDRPLVYKLSTLRTAKDYHARSYEKGIH